jgi:hypothetical protein
MRRNCRRTTAFAFIGVLASTGLGGAQTFQPSFVEDFETRTAGSQICGQGDWANFVTFGGCEPCHPRYFCGRPVNGLVIHPQDLAFPGERPHGGQPVEQRPDILPLVAYRDDHRHVRGGSLLTCHLASLAKRP